MNFFLRLWPILPLTFFAASNTFLTQGPGPSNNTQLGPNNADVGAVGPIVVKPGDLNTITVGGVNGGIWQTNDFGASWSPKSDFLTSLSIESLVYDPTNPLKLIAGTGVTSNGSVQGLGTFNAQGGPRIGVLTSSDGGTSWTTPANTGLTGKSVAGVLGNGSTIFAATFEPQAYPTFSGYGLYKSIDNGASFTPVTFPAVLPANTPVSSLVADPANPTSIYYAAVSDPNSFPDSRLAKSSDGGMTWASVFDKNTPSCPNCNPLVGATSQMVIKAATGPNGSVAILIVEAPISSPPPQRVQSIFYSSDGGSTWNQLWDYTYLNDPIIDFNPKGQGVQNSAIAIDPTHPNTVYVTGTQLPMSPFPLAAYSFTNPSTTSTPFWQGPDGSTSHADSWSLVFDGQGNLLVSSDGGLDLYNTSTGVWKSIVGAAPSGLSLMQPYSTVYDGNNNIILMASQDTAIQFQITPNFPLFQTLALTNPGDGTNAQINDSGSISYYYSSTESLSNLNRISNTNGQLSSITNGTPLTFIPDLSTVGTVFNSPFVLNRIDRSKFAIGATGMGGGFNGIYFGQDDFVSSQFFLTTVTGSIGAGNSANVIAYGAMDHPGALLAGCSTAASYLFYATDPTAPFFNITSIYGGQTPASVVFDGRTSARSFVCDGTDLYYSTNTGVNNYIAQTLPSTVYNPLALEFISNNGVNSILVGGLNTIGTSSPIAVADSDSMGTLSPFRLFGGGAGTTPASSTLPNTLVSTISYNGKSDTLTVGLFGRGAWLMYDTTSNFPSAQVLQFGFANNDSTPDASVLTNGNYPSRPLVKNGTGTLTITGNASYTGSTTVNAGTLFVNGMISSQTTVNSGGALGGAGTIASDVLIENGANLISASAMSTLRINGSLTLDAGTITVVEVSPSSSASFAVNGLATLTGSLSLNPDPGSYSSNLDYTILTSTQPLNGTYDPQILNLPNGWIPQIVYGPNTVQLLVSNTSSIGSNVPLSSNQKALLQYLKQFANVPALQPILFTLGFLSPLELQAALNSISPARNGATTFVANQTAFSIGALSENRLSNHRLIQRVRSNQMNTALLLQQEILIAEAETPDAKDPMNRRPAGRSRAIGADQRFSFWATGFGEFIHQNGQNTNPEISAVSSGAVLGYDYWSEKGAITGSIGYLHMDVQEGNHAGSGHSNGGTVSLYGIGYLTKGWYLEAGLMTGYTHYANQRHIFVGGPIPFNATATSKHHGWQLMPHLGAGYDFTFDWFVIEPFGSLDWVCNFQSDVHEKGAPPLDMSQGGKNASMLRIQAGCNGYQVWDTGDSAEKGNLWVLQESVSYVNKDPFNTSLSASLIPTASAPSGVPGSFTVQTWESIIHSLSLGAELFYKHKPSGFFFSASYDGEFFSGYFSNTVEGTLGVFF